MWRATHRGGAGEVLTFVYAVAEGDADPDGVSIAADSLSGMIRDGSNPAVSLDHPAMGADAGHRVDGVRPVLQEVVVDGDRLALTYDEVLNRTSNSDRPVRDAFTVTSGGRGVRVNRVEVVSQVVLLHLSSPVAHGETVTVSYTPGAWSIRDAAGNGAAAFSDRSATNETVRYDADRDGLIEIATGAVSGNRAVGGLVGLSSSGEIGASYWDTTTSGHATSDGGAGQSTATLQAPTTCSGINADWNDHWHLGASDQYPVLKADLDGDGTATWQEFGRQVRSGPTTRTRR